LVTIKDVAAKAGVAVSTVSRVLNGNHREVGAATHEKVLRVAAELNYRPNLVARSMIKKSSTTLGLVVDSFSTPINAAIMEGIEEVTQQANYKLLIAKAPALEREIAAIETLRQQQVDGFLLVLSSRAYPKKHLLELSEAKVPFVLLNRNVRSSQVNQVCFDDVEGAFAATEHLIKAGHTKIGIVTGSLGAKPLLQSAEDRYKGWRSALDEHQLLFEPNWVFGGDYSPLSSYHAAQSLMKLPVAQRPTALVIANALMATGVLAGCQEQGLAIPQDLAIVSIGDLPGGMYTFPTLTSFVPVGQEAGRVAARILLDWLKAGEQKAVQKVTLSFRLQMGNSCGTIPNSH
jgi:LacI family transcriptional regulator